MSHPVRPFHSSSLGRRPTPAPGVQPGSPGPHRRHSSARTRIEDRRPQRQPEVRDHQAPTQREVKFGTQPQGEAPSLLRNPESRTATSSPAPIVALETAPLHTTTSSTRTSGGYLASPGLQKHGTPGPWRAWRTWPGAPRGQEERPPSRSVHHSAPQVSLQKRYQ